MEDTNTNDNKQPPGLPEPLDAENTKQALEALSKLAERIAAEGLIKDGTEVDGALQEIKQETGISIKSLRANLKQLLSTGHVGKQTQGKTLEPETYTEDEIVTAEVLLKKPDLFEEFSKDFALTGYLTDNKLTTAGLLFLGRTLLPASSAQYNYGKTASGKTEFTLAVASFFSANRVVNLTDITPRYLYRRGGEDGKALQYCIVIFGEMSPPAKPGEDSIKQSAIRQLTTENKLTLGTVDDAYGQRNVAIDRVLHGPVTMVFTGTTSPSGWNDEMMNRTHGLHFKHTHATIKAVLKAKAARGAISSNPFAADTGELRKAQRKWRAAFSLLKRLDENDPTQFCGVEISFLDNLIFNKTRLTEPDMRSYEMLKYCIAVSALLHQRTRKPKEKDGKTALTATLQDYTRIKDAYLEMVPRTTQGLSSDLIEIFTDRLLPAWKDGNAKSQADIASILAVPLGTAKRYIYSWDNADLLEVDDILTPSKNSKAKKYYRLPAGCESLAQAILERGDLKINESACVSDETTRTSESDSRNLGTGDEFSLSTTELNDAEQPVNNEQRLEIIHARSDLFVSSHEHQENQVSAGIQGINSGLFSRSPEYTHTPQDVSDKDYTDFDVKADS